jgi:glucose-6-phosphate dehydrogenase assembly protein OpcA
MSPGELLDQVDRELRGFWSATPAGAETPKARACTRNLVVVAATPQLADRWVSIVDDVLLSIPARAIVVGLDPDGADGLEAVTTAVCVPGEGSAATCSERVAIQARGAACTRLASVIETLCATDVPTTLVWLGRVHADDLVFAPLARGADRIVLDAAQGSLTDLARVVRWARQTPKRSSPGVADLAWTRLAPWQELCARMFDEPRLRGLSARMTGLRIVQASTPGAALGSEGGLLLGWLATRLDWKSTSLAGRLRLVRPDDGPVHAQLRAKAAPQRLGKQLLAVELEASAGPIGLRGTIERDQADDDAATWRLEVLGDGEPRRIEQRVRLRASEPARLLERTLHRPPDDEALAESVAWADGLIGEEIACG